MRSRGGTRQALVLWGGVVVTTRPDTEVRVGGGCADQNKRCATLGLLPYEVGQPTKTPGTPSGEDVKVILSVTKDLETVVRRNSVSTDYDSGRVLPLSSGSHTEPLRFTQEHFQSTVKTTGEAATERTGPGVALCRCLSCVSRPSRTPRHQEPLAGRRRSVGEWSFRRRRVRDRPLDVSLGPRTSRKLPPPTCPQRDFFFPLVKSFTKAPSRPPVCTTRHLTPAGTGGSLRGRGSCSRLGDTRGRKVDLSLLGNKPKEGHRATKRFGGLNSAKIP